MERAGIVESRLTKLSTVYAKNDVGPCNIWPTDLSWFVYTGYDSPFTKVSGNDALIDAILADDVLEAVPA